ncbi:FRG domain-containing protein [Lysinibacillus sp. 3P01SB]|uniref:FRG domain-containing protein n=1 Tax=Lysinibacillus sp. 3P01SB TaxID=3132284 RepID=UPI0039A74FB5
MKKRQIEMCNNTNEKVNSIETFLNKLPHVDEKSKGNIFYRGQSKSTYDLKPSIFRENYIEEEHNIYTEVMTECGHEFENCTLHNEKLSKMQHYGVPTRLLDVTTNALVALYFACESNSREDGAVFLIRANSSQIKQFDSDTISILASLPRFTESEKQEIYTLAIEHSGNLSEDSGGDFQCFNNKPIIKRILHEIKKEKPAFENAINPKHLLGNYIFIPRKNNTRIIRQSGAFIIFGLTNHEEYKFEKDFEYKKIIINGDSKEVIIKQLASFGITKASIYPELYKVAEFIKERLKDRSNIYL